MPDARVLGGDRLALLNERDVSPGARAETLTVVHRHAGEDQPIFGDGGPLLAGHLAGLAADAHAGVGEKPHPRRVTGGAALGGGVGFAAQRTLQPRPTSELVAD